VGNSLDNPINWSFGVGRLFGVRIRVHILFVLGALPVLFFAMRDGTGLRGMVEGLAMVGMLFAIVLAHEFGHCFGARFSGGTADDILMWPLGGLAYTCPPHTPRANLITVVAGPMVNVFFLMVTGVVLMSWKRGFGALPLNPFKPFFTHAVIESEIQKWLVIFFTLNWMILLFNLAPVFPLDGGRVLQCVLWFRKGYSKATLIATGVGMVGAIVFGVLGLATGAMILFAIAFFGYFTCWQQRQMMKSGALSSENEFGYDFSQGYTSLEQSDRSQAKQPSFWERYRAKRAAAREAREAAEREELRRRIDAILEKVHRGGIQSLTAKERRILAEETERQRSDG
jgi:stage IV sporulation protein FB